MYDLPNTATINDNEYPIRTDYRDILTIIDILNNDELEEQSIIGNEKICAALFIFYETFEENKDILYSNIAVEQMFGFIDRGQTYYGIKAKQPVFDYKKDESLIIPAIGQVLNCRIRELPYLHWWDFVDAFFQISEGMFSFVVGVRNRKNKGKMTKEDKQFYSENRHLIDLKPKKQIIIDDNFKPLSQAEGEEFLKQWKGGLNNGRA